MGRCGASGGVASARACRMSARRRAGARRRDGCGPASASARRWTGATVSGGGGGAGDVDCPFAENDSCDGPRYTHERIVRGPRRPLSLLATLPPSTAPAPIAQLWGVTLKRPAVVVFRLHGGAAVERWAQWTVGDLGQDARLSSSPSGRRFSYLGAAGVVRCGSRILSGVASGDHSAPAGWATCSTSRGSAIRP
jgi:hypothetical protein